MNSNTLLFLLLSMPFYLSAMQLPVKNPRGQTLMARLQSNVYTLINRSNYDISTQEYNHDEITASGYAGSFTATFEHDALTGLLTNNGIQSFQQLLVAMQTGDQFDFNTIARAPGATKKLVNPQAAFAKSFVGLPCSTIAMPVTYGIASPEAAADIIEVYLQRICAHVLFSEYGTGAGTDSDTFNGGSLTTHAADILTALGSAYKGPSQNGIVTIQELFRGNTAADLVGPYISQFWYLSFYPYLQSIECKQHVPIAQDRTFGVPWNHFVLLQNGIIPAPYTPTDFSGQRYIVTGADAGTIVHNDPPGEYFFYAMNILLHYGFPLSPSLPYVNGLMPNEAGFVTMAVTDITTLLFIASQEALKHAWAHKWLANRKLRPEAMAGLIHQAKINNNNPFNLHSSIFATYDSIDLLAWVKNYNTQQESIMNNPLPAGQGETYLLSQLFPEAAPAHPSYPSGHATIAGACATILKAFFKEDTLIKSKVTPVKPSTIDQAQLVTLPDSEGATVMTVGGELDKLASNIGLARDFAGVHYRSDAQNGIALGEEVALYLLQAWILTYHEQGFSSFDVTKRNGEKVRITANSIQIVS